MRRPNTQVAQRKHGFALVVVLFALAVLAVLFSTASTRTLAGLQFNAAERIAAREERAEEVERVDGGAAAAKCHSPNVVKGDGLQQDVQYLGSF